MVKPVIISGTGQGVHEQLLARGKRKYGEIRLEVSSLEKETTSNPVVCVRGQDNHDNTTWYTPTRLLLHLYYDKVHPK